MEQLEILQFHTKPYSTTVGYADSVGSMVLVGASDGDPVGEVVGKSDGDAELQKLKAFGRGAEESSMILPFEASYHLRTSGLAPRLQSPNWNRLVCISV